MLEYKREKATLEARLDEYARRATHHDDHLRVVDAWWLQVSFLPRQKYSIEGGLTWVLATRRDRGHNQGQLFRDGIQWYSALRMPFRNT